MATGKALANIANVADAPTGELQDVIDAFNALLAELQKRGWMDR